MGCQCTKSTEKNAEIDTVPQPKAISELESKKDQTSKNESAIDESKTQKKKIIKKKKKKEEKSEINIPIEDQYLEHINGLRRNPKLYAEEVSKAREAIEVKDDKIVLKKGKLSCKLSKGIVAFDNIITKLNGLIPMGALSLSQDLIIDLTAYNDSKAITQALEKKKKELKDKGIIVDGYHDKISDPAFGVMMQVVDDNNQFNGKRSQMLMRNDFNYIGISCKNIVEKVGEKQVNSFVACFLFSK